MTQIRTKLAVLYLKLTLNRLLLKFCKIGFGLLRRSSCILFCLVLLVSPNLGNVCFGQAMMKIKLFDFENDRPAKELNETIKISLKNRSKTESYSGSHTIFCSSTLALDQTSFKYYELGEINLLPNEEEVQSFRVPKISNEGNYFLLVANEKGEVVSTIGIKVTQNGNVIIVEKGLIEAMHYLLLGIMVIVAFLVLVKYRFQKINKVEIKEDFNAFEHLVIKGKLEKALKLLYKRARLNDTELSNEILLLCAELDRYSKERLTGLIKEEDYQCSKNRLILRTLDLGNELEFV